MNEIKQINPKQIIKQSNRLVVARYRLTKYEQRMMIAICSQLNKNADEFETVRVRAKDLAEFCKFKGQDAYRKVHSTILKLMSRTLQIQKDDGKWYLTHWLQSAEYLEGGIIEYCIDQRLKPDLLQLKSAYLSTSAEPLMNFSRDYSARLYFILKKLVRLRTYIYDLDFFVDRFQLGKTYKQISNLKNRVLEPAIAEINEKSDILVRHDYIKEGRAYTKIQFIIFLKDEKNEDLKTDKKEIAPPALADEAEQPPQLTSSSAVDTAEPTKSTEHSAGVALLQAIGIKPPSASATTANATEKKEEPAPAPAEVAEKETTTTDRGEDGKLTAEQQADYDLLIKYEIWQPVAKKFVDNYSHAQIQRNVEGVLKSKPRGNIRDMSAVLVNAIANDTYKGLVEEQAQALEREKARRKAEYNAIIQHAKESEENRKNNNDKNKKLEIIRSQKSKEELIETFEKVSFKYKNNNEILNDEMKQELADNGIPEKDFTLYRSGTMRNLIPYIK